MTRWLFCLLTLAGIGGTAVRADCFHRSRVVYAAPAVVKKEVVVVKEAFIATYVPIPLYAATYLAPPVVAAPAVVGSGAAHAPPAAYANGRDDEILKALQTLNANVQSLDARLRTLEGGVKPPVIPPGTPPPVVPPPVKPPGAVDPFAPPPLPKPAVKAPDAAPKVGHGAKCATCHEQKVAKAQGGGKAFYDGENFLPLTDGQVRALLLTAYEGKTKNDRPMPPEDSGVPPLTDPEVGKMVADLKKIK